MTTYTRNDLAADLAIRLKTSETSARQAVNEFVAAIQVALHSGKRVEFRGFGTMEVRTRKAKVGRNMQNPSAGPVTIPPRRYVRFKAARNFDTWLNQ